MPDSDSPITSFQQAEDFLYRIKPGEVYLGLERLEKVLAELGDPHERMPAVLVGGTNGKGTVVTAVAQVLAERYKVGSFTKPHLVSVTERVQINGEPIDEETFTELTERARRASQAADTELTYFELTFLLGVLAFEKAEVDLAVIEVGLGGRLDAANVMHPVLSVITTVDLDHQHYLGDTVEEIAREKAGILPTNGNAVIGYLRDDAREVVEEEARKVGCTLHTAEDIIDLALYDPAEEEVRLHLAGETEMEPLVSHMLGIYQVEDLEIAIAALRHLDQMGYEWNREDLRNGIARAFIAARFDLRYLEGGRKVIFDAAHNPAGCKALAQAMVWFAHENRWPEVEGELHVVFGCQDSKEVDSMLENLAPVVDTLYPFEIDILHPLSKTELADRARELGMEVQMCSGWREALEEAATSGRREHPALCGGSIYYLGRIYRELGLPVKLEE